MEALGLLQTPSAAHAVIAMQGKDERKDRQAPSVLDFTLVPRLSRAQCRLVADALFTAS
jgi:hypothetical protein